MAECTTLPRSFSFKHFAVVLLALASILVPGAIAANVLGAQQHTVAEIKDASGYAWYVRDDRTLYRTDLATTYIVFRGKGGIRTREFHMLSPVVIDNHATASQAAAWARTFGP